ncbi:hypothetical protein ACWC1D_36555, partial [Streptomyces sp. NPDC001478]
PQEDGIGVGDDRDVVPASAPPQIQGVLDGGARDIGYGRTVWGRGERVTVNRTSFGGRVGVLLAGLGVATLAVTAAQLPPASLTPEEEEELRQQARDQSSSPGDGGDGGDGGGWDADWDHGEDSWSDDDFG